MPIYEYECAACQQRFEHLLKSVTDTPKSCPACGGKKITKALSAFSVGADRKPAAAASNCSSCHASGSCPNARR